MSPGERARVFTVTPMNEEDARVVLAWRYPAPYDLYNPDPETLQDDVAHLSAPVNRYFSVRDAKRQLVAFICFGEEARVPGGDYRKGALDVGCGLRPDLTGQGLGPSIIDIAVRFGSARFGTTRFRATIAAFNHRALRATQRAGFTPVSSFDRPSDGRTFVILEG
jgi:RimJ/RimL family protein N-acetyltransferase